MQPEKQVDETMSPDEPALQTGSDREVLPDRRLQKCLSIHFGTDESGLIYAYSDHVPEFYISGSNDHRVASDIEPVLSRILHDNYGMSIAEFCRSQIEERERAKQWREKL